jgi:hypothetical protein
MKSDALSVLLAGKAEAALAKPDVAYAIFGDGARRAELLTALRGRAGATALAERMLLSGDAKALAFQSPTVIASAIAVLALGGAATRKRLETLRKKGPPAARLHARVALGIAASKTENARIAALGAADGKTRERAADEAAEAAVPEALPGLRALLRDPQPGARVSAARALGTLGDAESFAPLHAMLAARPKAPPGSARGVPPVAVHDAMAAYDGLVRLGDARALRDILVLAGTPRYVTWIAALAEAAPLTALAQLQPLGIAAIAERALKDRYVLDESRYVPLLADAHAAVATRHLLERWRALGPATARKKRDEIAERLGESL